MVEGIGPLGRPTEDIGKHIMQNVDKRISGNPVLGGGKERMYKDLDEAVRVRIKSAEMAPGMQYISEETARLIVERATKDGEGGRSPTQETWHITSSFESIGYCTHSSLA